MILSLLAMAEDACYMQECQHLLQPNLQQIGMLCGSNATTATSTSEGFCYVALKLEQNKTTQLRQVKLRQVGLASPVSFLTSDRSDAAHFCQF